MNWGRVAARTFSATGEGDTLTLKAATSGASPETYTNCKREDRASFSARTGGQLQENVTQVISVPRNGTKPEEGWYATYSGDAVGIVRSVSRQAGYWIVGVGA